MNMGNWICLLCGNVEQSFSMEFNQLCRECDENPMRRLDYVN